MVFDTAHVWRSYKGKAGEVWKEFKVEVEKNKIPIYWHMNHNNGKHCLINTQSKHDRWVRQVARFAGERIRQGEDQICFEEPRRVRVRLSKREMEETKRGLEKTIVNLKQIGGL